MRTSLKESRHHYTIGNSSPGWHCRCFIIVFNVEILPRKPPKQSPRRMSFEKQNCQISEVCQWLLTSLFIILSPRWGNHRDLDTRVPGGPPTAQGSHPDLTLLRFALILEDICSGFPPTPTFDVIFLIHFNMLWLIICLIKCYFYILVRTCT